MDEQKKKILFIIGYVLIIIIAGFALYFVFFRAEPEIKQESIIQDSQQSDVSRLPTGSSGGTGTGVQTGNQNNLNQDTSTAVTQEDLINENQITIDDRTQVQQVANGGPTEVKTLFNTFTAVSQANTVQGGVNTYDISQGTFVRINSDGTKNELTDQKFFNVNDIQWAPSGQQAILGFPDGSKLYYDFSRSQAIRLPDQITDPVFNNTGSMIAFKWIDPVNYQNNYIGVSNPDGTGINLVEFLGNESRRVTINFSPDERYIASQRTGKTGNSQEIYFVGQNQENFKSLVVPGINFEYKYFSKDKILFTTVDTKTDSNPRLFIVSVASDSMGEGLVDTGIKTFLDKCTITLSGKYAYCAVPKEMPDGTGLVRDLLDDVEDYFYKIDLSDGSSTFLALPVLGNSGKVIARDLVIDKDEKTLFFTNDINGNLLSISLP